MTTEIVKINAADYGLDETKAQEITKGLKTILAEREALQEEYNKCIALEITEENIPIFKELRLQIRDNRTKGIEVWHKNNKAYFLAGGNFVDAIRRKESAENERMEEKLLDAEKFFENQERERLEKLRSDRLEMLKPYTDIEPLALGHMEQAVFDNLLQGFKVAYETRIAAEKKAEERAKREAEAKIRAEEKARKDAEKKAKLAPDKEKLLNFMQAINDLPRPEVKSVEAAKIASDANTLLVKVANYIKENSEKL